MLRIDNQLLRVALTLIAVAGILFFLLPLSFHIVNIGNLFGFCASVVLLGFVVWNRPLCDLLDRLWQHKAGKITLSVLGIFVLLGVLYCLVISSFMLHAANKKPKSQPQAMIVLGCKVRGTTPSLMLYRRILAAYDAMQQYPEMVAIVSGGQGSDEDITEASCMARELIRLGIPEQRILLEEQSASTSENLRFSKAILEERGLTGELLITTDGFHEMRAQYLAGLEGLPECAAASAHTSWYLLPTYWVREWFGLAHAFVFGD